MKFLKVNLENLAERVSYSEKLIQFETEFNYPLGDKTFNIVHGLTKGDYFSFFEQLGEISYLIVEKDNQIIGAVCAILRDISGNKVWYLCDFKISKKFRGQGIYKFLMLKFFFPHYFKSHRMFAINMSPLKNNKIYQHTKKIFNLFSIKIEARFLYQFESTYLNNFKSDFWEQHYICTNNGKKDIVIDGKSIKIYHIVERERVFEKMQLVDKKDIEINSQIMYLSHKKNLTQLSAIEISLIHRKSPYLYVSSAEI